MKYFKSSISLCPSFYMYLSRSLLYLNLPLTLSFTFLSLTPLLKSPSHSLPPSLPSHSILYSNISLIFFSLLSHSHLSPYHHTKDPSALILSSSSNPSYHFLYSHNFIFQLSPFPLYCAIPFPSIPLPSLPLPSIHLPILPLPSIIMFRNKYRINERCCFTKFLNGRW